MLAWCCLGVVHRKNDNLGDFGFKSKDVFTKSVDRYFRSGCFKG